MKTSPVMYKNETFLHGILMASVLGILFAQGYSSCFSPSVYRGTNFTTSPGKSLTLKCPVKECGENLEVLWSKRNGTKDIYNLRDELQKFRQQGEENSTIFNLVFNPVLVGDSGSYKCTINSSKGIQFPSHYIEIYVTNSTEASLEAKPKDERRPWLLYMLLSMGVLCILIPTSLGGLFFRLRKNRAKQKKYPDTLRTGINQVTLHQHFGDHQSEEGTIYNSTVPRPLPLSPVTIIYNNDTWPKVQIGPKVIYFNRSSEENQSDIVYASLNHSVNGGNNLKRAEHMEEQPTEYASICVRN